MNDGRTDVESVSRITWREGKAGKQGSNARDGAGVVAESGSDGATGERSGVAAAGGAPSAAGMGVGNATRSEWTVCANQGKRRHGGT